jgi:hypothetical protein
MVTKYSKWLNNMSTFSNLKPSKIYPSWDFWLEIKPSGNPVLDSEQSAGARSPQQEVGRVRDASQAQHF